MVLTLNKLNLVVVYFAFTDLLTRLIAIVSKPIKVVVVVIAIVVLTKKKIRSKIVDPKIIQVQKLKVKSVGSKKYLGK